MPLLGSKRALWTPEELKELVQLWNTACENKRNRRPFQTVEDIAKQLGRAPNSVLDKRHELQLQNMNKIRLLGPPQRDEEEWKKKRKHWDNVSNQKKKAKKLADKKAGIPPPKAPPRRVVVSPAPKPPSTFTGCPWIVGRTFTTKIPVFCSAPVVEKYCAEHEQQNKKLHWPCNLTSATTSHSRSLK